MKCKYCGAEIAEKTKICCQCGRFLGDDAEDTAKKRKLRYWIGGMVIAIAAVFVLTTFGSTFFQQKNANEVLEKQVAVASANNLGMNFEKFRNDFNDNEFTQRAKLAIGEPQMQKTEQNTQFQQIFTDKLALFGVIGKMDHKLLALQMQAIPSNVKEDQIRMVTLMGVLIDMFSPDVAKAERNQILQELGFADGKNLYQANDTAVRGNVRYRFKFDKERGFIFIVSNVNYQG